MPSLRSVISLYGFQCRLRNKSALGSHKRDSSLWTKSSSDLFAPPWYIVWIQESKWQSALLW
jgi:hypothetical protein